MSQDFAAAFGLGRTNRMIDMVDANGVAVVAIQPLHRRIEALEKEVARLRAGEGSPGSGGANETAGYIRHDIADERHRLRVVRV